MDIKEQLGIWMMVLSVGAIFLWFIDARFVILAWMDLGGPWLGLVLRLAFFGWGYYLYKYSD